MKSSQTYPRLVQRNVIEWVVKCALFLATSYFVWDMMLEYLEENTNFSVTSKPVTKDDLPTITVCLKSKNENGLKYTKDFTITTFNSSQPFWQDGNATLMTLQEGVNEYYYMRAKREIILEQLRVVQLYGSHVHRSCVSMKLMMEFEQITIDSTIDEGTKLDVALISIDLSKKAANSTQEATLYITSEENSYGAVLNSWYNGQAKPALLPRGGFLNIQISKMTRYEYLEKKCNRSSFYECIGEKLTKQNECHVKGITCIPYTFPNNKPPICPKNETIETCVWNGNKAVLSAMKKCLGQKPCSTEEYEYFLNEDWSTANPSHAKVILESVIGHKSILKKFKENQMNKYLILFEFAKAKWANGPYAMEVQKEIYKEYLAWTGTSMIGNVGGQLGLWVGFSVTGFIAGTFNVIPKMCKYVVQMLK